ncbi:AlkZ family DNA glycosylase [Dactylosporangium roseum]|uniref:AlkZ family DNA glycosylase n=1 Tax=Dactylosporangium roseum TaxID=47989 RepID=A0ABY5ZAE7_9ACTN|nr:winged helix DNA-binding domain-containing protein [Dactylosporangium roseum]UWZ37965.1 AlkZ family DNA glycosylase [Dactylosporangium roseum]
MKLSTRQLNRTYLQRQLLLRPDPRPVDEVVAHLVAVQAQEVDAPYVGLWTRMAGLKHEQLTAALEDRRLVRGGLLRGTQHITAGDDYLWLRPLVRERIGRGGLSAFRRQLDGLDLAELAAAGREILRGQVLTRPKLAKLLGERFPGRDALPLAWAAQHQLALIHPPPTGVWRRRGHVSVALAEDWLGRPLEEEPKIKTLLERYLLSCGPATHTDLRNWAGLRRLRDEVEALRPALRVYRAEDGRELFDLPDLPIADPDEPAPVRFLPEFDNLVLSHDDRTRIISDTDRARVCPGYSMVHPTFLVDGFVAGIWAVDRATLRITPFRRLSETDAATVLGEAANLLDFLRLGPDAVVRLDQPGTTTS